MTKARLRWVVLTLVVTGPGLTAPAGASYEGTPGRVAYLTNVDPAPLNIWGPATESTTEIEPTTFTAGQAGTVTWGGFPMQISAGGMPSAPSWSPDGTRLAYSKMIPDQGEISGLKHSAIFVYRVADGTKTQVTFPQDAVFDGNPDPPHTGHTVTDWSPTWNNDGTQLAFVRLIQAYGPDDTLYSKRGQNMWKVPATGGVGTQITTFVPESGVQFSSAVWIPQSQDMIAAYAANGSPALGRLSSGGGSPQFLAGSPSQAITDYDVSPDGAKLVFGVVGEGGVTPFIQPLSGSGSGAGVQSGSGFGAIVRYSNSGDGVLHSGCTDRSEQVCGLLTRLTEDPDADIRSGELDRLALAWDAEIPGGGGTPTRMAFDIQPQTLPIVFVPGFLGSQITCDAGAIWPPAFAFVDAPKMELAADGVTNTGCATAGPNGRLVETVGPKDIYKSIADFLRTTFPDGRAWLFAWDWRKRPQESLDALGGKISEALLTDGAWKDQNAGRVVLAGHSYGGLLIRTYLKEHPGKVARVLTLGTPYWGAPKSIFPLAFGVENPGFSPIDAMFDNDQLHDLAVNLGGLYQLYPSDRFSSWLSVDNVVQGTAGVSSFVAALGGNVALHAQARSYHSSVYEGFFDNGGRIDVRAVVGSGEMTFDKLNFVRRDDGDADLFATWGNGDGTVPGRSGAQGPMASVVPPAPSDPIHIQFTCHVDHVALAGDAGMRNAYRDFLDVGRTPRKLRPGICLASGDAITFPRLKLGIAEPRATTSRTGRAAGDPPAGPFGLAEAEAAGLIDLVELPHQVFAVTDDDQPVTLRFTLSDATFTVTPLSDAGNGQPRTYGPLSGTVELTSGTGTGPIVTVDGVPVAPNDAPRDDQVPTSDAIPASTPMPAPAATVAPPGSGPGALPVAAPSNRVRVVGRATLRRRRIRITLQLPGKGSLRLRATTAGKRVRTLGTLRATIRAKGRRTFAITCKGAVPAKIRLKILFTPTGGRTRTITLTVRRSR